MATHARKKIRARRLTLPPLPSLMQEMVPSHRLHTTGAGKVLKSDWTDPGDTTPCAARTARAIHGHRAFCPLRWCIRRHGPRSNFTAEHVEAADRLHGTFDGARLGFAGLKDRQPVRPAVYRPALGPTAPAMRQWRCRVAFDHAWTLFADTDRAMLALVVLQNVAIGKTADLLEIPKPLMTERLVAVLGQLCRRFDIRATGRAA
jgi:hypothetical protein